MAHPRLNPNYRPVYKDYFDTGAIVHDLMLEGGGKAHIITTKKMEGRGKNRVETDEVVEDYKTDAAKAERDEARAAGKIPILPHKWAAVERMVSAAKKQIANHEDAADMFTEGKPEVTLRWEEDGILFRSRLDWLHFDCARIDDLKTSGISANPEVFTRQMFANGLDIQAALYRRAVNAVHGTMPRFRFAVVETEDPHALSVIEPSAGIITIGEKKIEYAKTLWRDCLASNKWPGYPAVTHKPELPEWEEKRVIAKEEASVISRSV